MHKFKFSFVIPIYNVEKYIRETIESVINQDIGFVKNIQLILVNDGSPDNSEKICVEYADKYKDNVVYIKQENQGVSAARNHGLRYVEGKYVNFLDSDDTWNPDTCRKVWRFFEQHENEIDFVAGRIKFFEARRHYHILDYKFKKMDRIADIFKLYDFVQLSMATTFIKSSVFQKFKFDTDLIIAEDMKLINMIVLEKCKYGIMKSIQYNYRSRYAENSAMQSSKINIEWYTSTPKKCHEFLIEYSKKKFGEVIPYIQFVIMYDLQWRLRNPIQKDLDDNTKKEYRSQVVYLLQSIDDSIINEQKNMNSEDKVYALCTKYNRDIQEDLVFREGQLFFEDNMMYRIRNYSLFTIHIIDIIDNHLHMEGRINSFIHLHDCRYFIRSGKDFEKELTFFELPGDLRYGMDGVIGKRMGFIVDIPLKNTQKIRFTLNYKNDNEIRLLVAYGRFTKLDRNLKHSYCIIKNYLLTSQRGILTVKCYRRKAHLIKELRKLWRLLVIKKWEVFFFRLLYYLNKRRYRNKEIWFVSDQQKTVGDNGEFMFRYIMKHKPEGIHAFFILSKDSKDIEKMEEVGPVVIEFSFQHKFYSLFASKIISSHANETSLNPFLQNRIFIKDLYHFDFVFLQHGIIMNDLSGWLNKFNKNIKLFITSAKQEYLSIVKNYMYDEKIVKLTGLPRYDGLMVDEKPKKQILLSPTWRRKLAQWDGGSGDDGERRYNPYFKDSEYYKFYNTLINDKRLLDALKEYGYRMKFCNHHAMKQQNQDFLGNDYVEINQDDMEYQNEIKENSLLVTDYSSITFDFGYLNKPVIYTQFDIEEFYEGQVYDMGYFDFEKDGLGPVCRDYESTINQIIAYIKSGCKMEDKYSERVQNFYAHHDNRNCERVYQEILDME